MLDELLGFLPPQARGELRSPRHRQRKKSLPLPLVKRSVNPASELQSEPALPLVRRGAGPAAAEAGRAVLELVSEPPTDDD
jgi:hypothetical protein